MIAADAASPLRILCLHGRGGSGQAFLADSLAPLRDALSPGIPKQPQVPVAWEAIDSLQSGGSWWSYPAGQRSFSATEYYGAEDSVAQVERELASGRYCGLLGYSQGAMLAAVVAARAALGEGDKAAAEHLKFAIICSAALPNPYRPLLERLRSSGGAPNIPTLHCLSKSDTMNPPELGEELASCFGVASSQVLWHGAGHKVPPRDSLGEVVAWLDANVPATPAP